LIFLLVAVKNEKTQHIKLTPELLLQLPEDLRLKLKNAVDEVDFVSAHATATKMGDIIEAQAIHTVYGHRPFVTGLKSYMGHTMSACGVIETIITLYLMSESIVVPTLNLDDVDEQCASINHPTQMQEHPIQTAAIQNFAFGGVNTNLIIKKLE